MKLDIITAKLVIFVNFIAKEKYTAIKGNDRFDTLYKALDFINR